MSTQILLHLALAVHLIALTMAVGVTAANAVASNQFWKLYDKNTDQGLASFRTIKKFQVLGMLGLLLLILSGITLLWLYNWAYGEQLWFKIKMTILLLIFVNGFTLGRSTTLKLEKILQAENAHEVPDTMRLRRNLRIFHLTQLTFFFIIIVLAVFKFT